MPAGEPKTLAEDILAHLERKHAVSPLGLDGMRLVVPAKRFAWVPEHLFDPMRSRQYLDFVGEPDAAKGVVHIRNKALGACMVFDVDNETVNPFKVHFPGIDVHCPHSVLVSADLLRDSTTHPLMLLHLDDVRADVEVFYAGQLHLSNSYPAASPDEALYYAIDIMKRLHLETPDMELRLCGNVDRAVYARYQRYFPNVGLHVGLPVTPKSPTDLPVPTYRHPLLFT